MKYNKKNRNIEVVHTFTDWHAGRYHLYVSKRVYHSVTIFFHQNRTKFSSTTKHGSCFTRPIDNYSYQCQVTLRSGTLSVSICNLKLYQKAGLGLKVGKRYIHRINCYPANIRKAGAAPAKTNYFYQWIVIYPADNAFHLLKNWGHGPKIDLHQDVDNQMTEITRLVLIKHCCCLHYSQFSVRIWNIGTFTRQILTFFVAPSA